MPVRSEASSLWSFDDLEGISADDLLTSSFPSDDIWKKFDFVETLNELAKTPLEDEDMELDAVLEWSLDATTSEIRHHDCMWAGHCGSKEHKPESIKIARPFLQVTCSPAQPRRPAVPQPPTQYAGRSLLLTSRINSATNPTQTQQKSTAPKVVGQRPDSPPSSDDDDHPRFKHEVTLFGASASGTAADNKTLQFLHDAISECDFDEDSDLCDYFEDSDVFQSGEGESGDGDGDSNDADDNDNEGDGDSNDADDNDADDNDADGDVETEVRESAPRDYSCVSDHSYHKGKGAQLRTDHLGVQTPSDSEEEIDVVSIGEKQITTNRNCTVLPTNPSIRDRQKLQRTVASAISCKREFPVAPTTGGIKTRLPLRLPSTSSSNSKKRSTNGGDGRRGVKRGRHRYGKAAGSPAKRRGCHSSESESECSEKRSLHNNMERQRRVDLRNAFDDLRVMVPEVSCKERAAKVVILREAATYCDRLGAESHAYQKQVAELRRQQERLRARLSQLRRSLAAKR